MCTGSLRITETVPVINQSVFFQAGKAHHAQGGTLSPKSLSPGPSECRGSAE